MWNETFDTPRKQGLERLTGGNKYRYYCNERVTVDGQYAYDVYEFDGKPSTAQVKAAMIAETYSLEEEFKILRKTLAAVLTGNAVSDEFAAYNAKVEEITYAVDSLGKVVQTAQGTGTPFDPYKVWKSGMSVKAGEWWQTDDGYLWESVKTGVPASSTDGEYWDIPG